MNRNKYKHIVASLAISALLLAGLFLLQNHGLRVARADPGEWFVKPNGTGSACTPAHPCALPDALSKATDGDTVYVARGTYTGTGGAVITITQSITLYGGWAGTTATPPVRDPSLYPTRLDGENARRVVYVGEGITPTIDGFIIARGNASNGINPGRGGGICASDASPVVTNNVITNNVAYTSTNNWGYGGGIYLGYTSAPALISGNLVVSNTANGMGPGKGGGLYVTYASATIHDNTFRGNIAGYGENGMGGGLCLYRIESQTTVSGNRIEHNKGTASGEGFGGGFYSQIGTVTLEGNTIVSNTAAQGAVTLEQNDNMTMTNNVVAQNAGGGVFVRGNASYPFAGTLAHNTIAQNGSEGVYVDYGHSGYAALTLINNVIVSHTTGIYSYQDLVNPNVVTATHTLFYGNGINASGSLITNTDEIAGSNPLFVDPAGWDYHIAGNSPAVDHGTALSWVVTDVDGEPRPSSAGNDPAGARYDIGADEVQWQYVYVPLVMKRYP